MSPQTLAYAGRTKEGHFRLIAPSKSRPGQSNLVLVSMDGSRVSCACAAAQRHPQRVGERAVLSRADVRAGIVKAPCWHAWKAARWSPGLHAGRQPDGAFFTTDPPRAFGYAPADVRRIARLIRRAGHSAEIRRADEKGATLGYTLLVYRVGDLAGTWTPGGRDDFEGLAFLRAVEDMGFNTGAETMGSPGDRWHMARAFHNEDPDELDAVGSGDARADAAVALAFAVERLTRGWRYSPRTGRCRLGKSVREAR